MLLSCSPNIAAANGSINNVSLLFPFAASFRLLIRASFLWNSRPGSASWAEGNLLPQPRAPRQHPPNRRPLRPQTLPCPGGLQGGKYPLAQWFSILFLFHFECRRGPLWKSTVQFCRISFQSKSFADPLDVVHRPMGAKNPCLSPTHQGQATPRGSLEFQGGKDN